MKKKNPSFLRAVFFAFYREYLPLFCIFTFQECGIRTLQPYLLRVVIQYFDPLDTEVTDQTAVLCAVGIVLCSAWFIVANYICVASALKIAMRIKAASCALIFKKSMKLSKTSLGQTAVGQIINIVSNDMNRFDEVRQTVAFYS